MTPSGGAVTLKGGFIIFLQAQNLSLTNTPGILARGFDVTSAGQTAGNGGTVILTASSISIPTGIVSRGGDALFGQLHASLVRYAAKHHGASAARFSGVVLDE